jgi:hypothetical protein
VRNFHYFDNLGVSYFNNIYKEIQRDNIAEIVKVVTHFPWLIFDEDNQSMFE